MASKSKSEYIKSVSWIKNPFPNKNDDDYSKESYLPIFINIMYHLYLVPFKMKTCEKTRDYYLVTNKFQKLFCAFFHSSLFLTQISFFVLNFSTHFDLTSDLSQLLRTVGNVTTCITACLGSKLVWCHQNDILQLAQSTKVPAIFPNSKFMSFGNFRRIIVTFSIFAYLFKIPFVLWLNNSHALAHDKTYAWIINLAPPGFLKMILLICIKILEIVVTQSGEILILPRVWVVVMSIQLKGLSMQFERFLQNENVCSVVKVMEIYQHLKDSVGLCNRLTDGILLTVYISLVAILANLPGVIRDKSEDKIGRIYSLFTFIQIAGFIVIACDMPERVKTCLKKWIHQKRMQKNNGSFVLLSQDDKLLLLALSHEVESETVGFPCSFFTLTYGFLLDQYFFK